MALARRLAGIVFFIIFLSSNNDKFFHCAVIVIVVAAVVVVIVSGAVLRIRTTKAYRIVVCCGVTKCWIVGIVEATNSGVLMVTAFRW